MSKRVTQTEIVREIDDFKESINANGAALKKMQTQIRESFKQEFGIPHSSSEMVVKKARRNTGSPSSGKSGSR